MKKTLSFTFFSLLMAGMISLPSCTKCKTCTLTTVSQCARCVVGGIEGPEVCEATNKNNYETSKSVCAAASGSWTITDSDTTRVSEELCSKSKVDVLDQSIELRLKGYVCADK